MHALYTNTSNNLRPQWMATPLEEVCLAQLVIPKCHTCREWAVSLSNNHYKASRRCLSRLLPALWKRWTSRKAFRASGSSLVNLGKKWILPYDQVWCEMIFGCCQNNDVQNGAICFLMNIGGLKKSSIMENATSSDRRSGLQTWLVWGEGGGGRMQDQDLWALFNLLIMLTTNSPALMNKQSLEFQTTSDCRSRSIRLIVISYVYILPAWGSS